MRLKGEKKLVPRIRHQIQWTVESSLLHLSSRVQSSKQARALSTLSFFHGKVSAQVRKCRRRLTNSLITFLLRPTFHPTPHPNLLPWRSTPFPLSLQPPPSTLYLSLSLPPFNGLFQKGAVVCLTTESSSCCLSLLLGLR